MSAEQGGKLRYVLASLAAAAAGAAGLPLGMFVIGFSSQPEKFWDEANAAGVIFCFALVVTAAHVVALGLPAVWLLKRFDAFNFRNMTVAGFVIGAGPAGILNMQWLLWGGLFGAVGAMAFWGAWRIYPR